MRPSTIVSILLAALLVFLGWAANTLGIFFNVLAQFLLLAVPVQILRALWRLFRGTAEFGIWRHPGNFRWHWGQIGNREIFWLLAGLVLEICIVPAQFEPSLYSGMRLVFWGAIGILMLLELIPAKRLFVATNCAFLAGSVFMLVQIISIHWPVPPSRAVSLAAPFRGEWLVLQGGRSSLINHHFGVEGQRDALDLERIVQGQETAGDKKRLSSYPSWEETLHAPADGKIVAVENDLPDNPVGDSDPRHAAGNFLVIEMGNSLYVTMAHLQKGSITVAPGDRVHAGQPVARCGNSGNTSHPHLHIQAQNQPDLFAAGTKTYPIIFRDVTLVRSGRTLPASPVFLRRNDRIVKED